MSNTFYVKAVQAGDFADCSFYTDPEGQNLYPGDQLKIPCNAGQVIFGQTETTELMLIGATFKTIGSPVSMNANNFAPANDENVVTIGMPTTGTPIIKGVILLFSTGGTVQNIFASSDPQVMNDGPSC